MNYSVITGPEVAHRVSSPEEYLEFHRAAMAGRGTVREWTGPVPIVHVSQGRCCIRCPQCKNGPSASRAWGLACCCSCGLIFRKLAFPRGWDEMDALLSARPPYLRDAVETDTPASLASENRRVGLDADPDVIRMKRAALGLGAGAPFRAVAPVRGVGRNVRRR